MKHLSEVMLKNFETKCSQVLITTMFVIISHGTSQKSCLLTLDAHANIAAVRESTATSRNFMPDDDWNSGRRPHKKLRCVSLSTGFIDVRSNRSRECFEMENPLFIVIHSYLESISINSVECIRLWRQIFERFPETAMIWARKNAPAYGTQSARRNINQLRGTREANTRRGISDSALFAGPPAARGRDAAAGPHGWWCYSCRSTRTRKIITVVCLFVRATRSPLDWFGERILIWNPFQSRISCFCSTQSTQNGRKAWFRVARPSPSMQQHSKSPVRFGAPSVTNKHQ